MFSIGSGATPSSAINQPNTKSTLLFGPVIRKPPAASTPSRVKWLSVIHTTRGLRRRSPPTASTGLVAPEES